MRCACIDIGSNTTRLLVAERGDDGLCEVVAQRAFTRLRAGDGPIPPEKARELSLAVAAQVAVAREWGSDDIRVVATAAFRRAANRRALCDAVEAEAGMPVEVLSGEEEARLAFAGATARLRRAPVGPVGVVDVGGGSTELACGTVGGDVHWSASLGVGSGLLADARLHGDPPSADELAGARDDLAALFAGLDAPDVTVAYAVGGSATSLRRLLGPVLGSEALRSAIELLVSAPSATLAKRLGLHAERVRLLPAGLLVLEAAGACFGVALEVADGGLREGVVLERLAGSGL